MVEHEESLGERLKRRQQESEQRMRDIRNFTQASNPGRLKISILRYWRNYPKWPTIWALLLLLSILAAWKIHWTLWILAGLLLALNLLYWSTVKKHFRLGCINPAKVVSLDPMRIAVATDLSQGGGIYPSIFILEKSVTRICGRPPELGMRLATISMYQPYFDEERPYWETFDPLLVDLVTGDLDKIQSILDSIPGKEWEELETWLAQVPTPYKPGLFRLWEKSSQEQADD
ncbi:MAG TPA: DUF3239 domain-containing protein [Planctomycetes bacterium]|nr:DUF3239 domain-containing protein [Planctomycetota bacterium]